MIRLTTFLLILTTFSNPTLGGKPCEIHEDCAFSEITGSEALEDFIGLCINNICSCPTNKIPLSISNYPYDGELDICIPPMIDTKRSCIDNSSSSSNCDSNIGKCQNSTCHECTFGRLSNSSGECEGPFNNDACRRLISSPEFRFGPLQYSQPCKIEGQRCERETNKCTCDDDKFYDEKSKACATFPKLGESCEVSERCIDEPKSYGYTRCSENKTCVCKGLIKNETNYCLQWPTGRCDKHEQCPENSRCIGNECDCNKGFVDGRAGECLKFMWEQRCQNDPDSETQKALDHQRLVCINGRYRCKIPTEQYYAAEPADGHYWSGYYKRFRHICVTEVGGTCDSIEDTRCTDGASCVNNLNGHFECQCDPGHSSTPENKCLKHVGIGEDCDGEYGDERKCDHYAGVFCMNNTCQCPDKKMQFDPVIKRCLSPEGHFCGDLTIGSKISQIGCKAGLKCALPDGPILSKHKCLKP